MKKFKMNKYHPLWSDKKNRLPDENHLSVQPVFRGL
jgi:hypothetical protein